MLRFIKSVFTQPLIRDIERAYLDASVSRTDLERRQREIDRGLFRHSGFDY